MNWAQRWKWWRQRRVSSPPDDIHRAGELAEQRLAKISRAAGKSNGWNVFESVRIPDVEQGGKREIDLVIVGGGTMLVVEQKHWSGSFTINHKEEFIQQRNNGTSHNHSTVSQRIERKAKILHEMFKARHPDGEDINVRVLLAFTHHKLEWPNNIGVLNSDVKNEKQFIALLEEENPGPINQNLLDFVSGFGTWDEIELNGGLMLKGDVLGLGLGDDIARWQKSCEEPLLGNAGHARSFFSLWSKEPSNVELYYGQQHVKASLPYGKSLRMHVVGRKEPEDVPWAGIVRLNLSKPPSSP